MDPDTAPSVHPPTRKRRMMLATAGVGLTALLLGLGANLYASAATTLFSDGFENGTSSWSKSGGTWSVVSDGTNVFKQADATSENARQFAGDTSWTDFSLQARVKPLSFGSGGLAGIDARVQSSTKFYRLALLGSGGAQLQAVSGSTITVIGSSSQSISTGTWYTLRIDVTGSTITAYLNGSQIASGSNSTYGTGRIGLQTLYASASFDDVSVTSGASTPTPTATSSSASATASPSTPTTTNPPTTTTGLVGWAAQNGGTTGGAGGSTVTVTTASALDTALQSSSATIVQVSGMISLSGMHKVASNKTVIGVGSSSGITGGGLNVANASNVIIRNMVFKNADDDSINVQYSTNVWIDHNDLSNGYDGLVDVKRASDYVTISWNHVHDHDKSMLLGHDDGNSSEDSGKLRVTYHHNWYDGTTQRHPRVRFGNPVHVYNNYYNNNSGYGVAATCESGVLVESNYFENVEDPFHLAEGDSPAGNLVAKNNYLTGSGAGETGGSVKSIPYTYSVDAASSVKSIVTSGAGTGKI